MGSTSWLFCWTSTIIAGTQGNSSSTSLFSRIVVVKRALSRDELLIMMSQVNQAGITCSMAKKLTLNSCGMHDPFGEQQTSTPTKHSHYVWYVWYVWLCTRPSGLNTKPCSMHRKNLIGLRLGLGLGMFVHLGIGTHSSVCGCIRYPLSCSERINNSTLWTSNLLGAMWGGLKKHRIENCYTDNHLLLYD